VGKKKRWRQITTVQSFKTANTVRVFGITRVSTDKQAQKVGESLDHQKEVLESWVKTKSSIHLPQKWELVEIFVENEDKSGVRKGRSATTRDKRTGLRKALELARARLIDVVVVTKLDRIARNVGDYIDISAEFNECGVALVCLDLDIDTSTPDGQMIMRNHANLAQWQAERIAQYSVETVQRHAEQGRPIGPPPVGYKLVRNGTGHASYAIDSKYKIHVETIDQLYLEFESSDRVVLELHKKGFKTRRGKTYTKSQVTRILQNIRYTGKQEYDGKSYKGNWPAIRSAETQDKIEAVFKRNRRTNHTQNVLIKKKYVYLLQGLLKCPKCSSSMMPKPGTGGRKRKQYYPYYLCVKADKTKGIDCETTYVPAEAIDRAVVEFVRKLRLDNTTIEQVVSRANRATSNRIGTIDKDLKRVKDSLHQIRIKISNVVDVLADKGVSQLKPLKEKLENLSQEEQELTREEKRLEQEISAEKRQAGSAHEQIQTLHLFNDLYAMNQDNPERLKMLMPRFIKYVICHFTDRQKGIGRLELGLFGRPFEGSENSEIWNETLKKLAEQCNKQLIADWKKAHAEGNGRKRTTAPTVVPLEPRFNQRDDSAAGVVSSPANEFIPGYQMGSLFLRSANRFRVPRSHARLSFPSHFIASLNRDAKDFFLAKGLRTFRKSKLSTKGFGKSIKPTCAALKISR